MSGGYTQTEKDESKTRKMVCTKRKGYLWHVYDWEVNKATVDPRKASRDLLQGVIKELRQQIRRPTARIGLGCRGGLLTYNDLPRILVMGCTDQTGPFKVNRSLRIQRAKNLVSYYFPSDLRKRTKIADLKYTQLKSLYINTENTPQGRAENRGVLIWKLAPVNVSVVDQKRRAKKEANRIFKDAIDLIKVDRTYNAIRRKRATCMLEKLLNSKSREDEKYYTKKGIDSYWSEKLYSKGISPGGNMSHVSYARQELEWWVLCSASMGDFVEHVFKIEALLMEGWFAIDNHTWRMADPAIKRLHKWVSEKQSDPKSINSCHSR